MKMPFTRRADRAAVLLGLGSAAIVACLGCHRAAAPSPNKTAQQDAPRSAAAPAAEPTSTGRPVLTSVATARPQTNPLNAQRAFGYLQQLCKLGPRPSGSPGMARQQAMLTRYFEELGAQVRRQEFPIRHPLDGRMVRCANLIVEWHPETTDRVLLCAHYDTRPLPDQDPNPIRRREGVFLGANDGASGVAVLMELARNLGDLDLAVGVDFVLFDAEELIYGGRLGQERGEYFLGSTHFARDYRANRPRHRYRWGVLLDMVGDAELQLLQEGYSVSWPETRPLVIDLWTTASRLGVEEFVPRTKRSRQGGFIKDDHLPLRNIARIPTCNIIDADYPDVPFGAPGSYWHTEQDVPENCSGESLAKVGWVVLEWLRTVEVP